MGGWRQECSAAALPGGLVEPVHSSPLELSAGEQRGVVVVDSLVLGVTVVIVLPGELLEVPKQFARSHAHAAHGGYGPPRPARVISSRSSTVGNRPAGAQTCDGSAGGSVRVAPSGRR